MSERLAQLNAAYRQQGLPEMRVGIGIYSGELVSCSLGSAERQQYSTVGDTSNTAARLTTVAKDMMKAGRTEERCFTVIGETTYALVAGEIEVRPIGRFSLKGKAQSVACYALAARGEALAVGS
jgi:adenylate cyclase